MVRIDGFALLSIYLPGAAALAIAVSTRVST